jgi:hypothetical protein
MTTASASKPRLGPSPSARNLGCLLEYGGKAAAKSSKLKELSANILDTLTSTRNVVVLHIQPEGFPDHLLRLHILLQTINKYRIFSIKERKDIPLGVVVVVDSLNSNNSGFKQACWVASERTQHKGSAKCGGAAYLFGKDFDVAVVKGLAMNDQGSYKPVVSRLGQAILNIMKSMRAKGFVWHECATIALLARTLQEVSNNNERNIHTEYFKGVCCTSGLTIDRKGCTVKFGLKNAKARKQFLGSLEKFRIPLIFLDSSTFGLPPVKTQTSALNTDASWNPLSSHLPYLSVHWPRLLPSDSWRPLLGQGMDKLATTVFRLRAAIVPGGIGDEAVAKQVKNELGPNDRAVSLVKSWAKKSINATSYASSALMNLKLHFGTELWQAYLLSNCPVDFPLDSLIGGLVDPGTKLEGDEVMALRVDIDFSSLAVCVNAYSKVPTYILVPTSNATKTTPSKFVANHLNSSWGHLITSYPSPQSKQIASIPKEIAESWEVLAVAAMKNLQVVGKSKAYEQWGKKEQALFGYVVQAIWGRDLTTIAANSLGRHPMNILATKK